LAYFACSVLTPIDTDDTENLSVFLRAELRQMSPPTQYHPAAAAAAADVPAAGSGLWMRSSDNIPVLHGGGAGEWADVNGFGFGCGLICDCKSPAGWMDVREIKANLSLHNIKMRSADLSPFRSASAEIQSDKRLS